MNCQLQSLCVVAIAGLMLSLPSPAGAQPVVDLPRIEVVSPPVPDTPPKPPEAQSQSERTLVVGVRGLLGAEERMTQALAEHLRNVGLTVVDYTNMEPSRVCDTVECLEELAKRERAGILVSAQLVESVLGTFAITLSIFDAVRRASLQEQAECRECNQALLNYKLNEVVDTLISRCREARLSPTVAKQTATAPVIPRPPSPPVIAPRAAPPPKLGFFASLSPTRKRLAIALGSLAGAALITSVVLTVTNGLDTPIGCEVRTDVLQDKCILKNKPLYASGYALTGALAVGIGFTLFWPKKPAQAATPEVR